MKKFLINRSFQLLIVILGATFLTFAITFIAPSDPAEMMYSSRDIVPTEEMLEQTRDEMGLNDPFLVQYGRWLTDIARGDLGYSYSLKTDVSEILSQKMGKTVCLACVAIVILFVVSFILGVIAAIYKNRLIDHLIKILSILSISIPSFWLGLILIYQFVVQLHLFKITDCNQPSSVVLPALTLAIPLIGRYTMQIRAEVLDELGSNYVLGARTRGVKESRIIFSHVIPNTLVNIITLFGMTIAFLLGGTAIVEIIFSWPGLGSMALEAINHRDYVLLQAYVLLMALIYVGMNFIVDIVTQIIDPRVNIFGGGSRHE
ncbi:ABC-type dipeptide/oligopeptide/nickel transport system, permease component [Methanolobus tindarius DSM 2278]|uniref:ABC-type dipeptide/oligopeptide/nickel transport system, permease component n=1 Tax=Methanolobus tindarius DSM 2278 TaxID=1090322 RepID=W9DUI3_METTI|nr:nickel ABC transporter permease [Methanolobus tindarius]ETA69295.1 ABC-type dipeptide/oligopeptide/nickel transport system, permease component [Methanolobus tindarius DSM 2278]